MKNRILILAIFLITCSCKDKEEKFDQGYAYAPLNIGDYKIYEVLKTSYVSGKDSTEQYQIKEVLTDTFTIGTEKKYRLERYKRANGQVAWPVTPDSVWTASLYPSRLIRTENNVRYVKLIFPPVNGKIWDGNIENGLGADDYTLTSVEKNFTVLDKVYAPTLTVVQSPNDSNKVYKDYRSEVYARDIGLIYKVKESYSYKQMNGVPVPGYVIDYGVKYYERLSAYGKQ